VDGSIPPHTAPALVRSDSSSESPRRSPPRIRVPNLRTHGAPPFSTVALHGGPGAAGSVASLARELARDRGVLEPWQTADSFDGQVEELRGVLERFAHRPVDLIGWSWGAFLGFAFASRYPDDVRRLVLVSSGPFEARYAPGIASTRLARLDPASRRRAQALLARIRAGEADLSAEEFDELGRMFDRADAFDAEGAGTDPVELDASLFRKVWGEAERRRASGELLEMGRRIRCPVVAIHGDHDPHPAEGVRGPLSGVLREFRFVPLERCGHTPWLEREARVEFYRRLRAELAAAP
jgi:pimeloyl-ACP methyl ester carboxylesterase